MTIDRPIVTIVCRRSSPGMRRKISTCISEPDDRRGERIPPPTASSHEPVRSATKKPT